MKRFFCAVAVVLAIPTFASARPVQVGDTLRVENSVGTGGGEFIINPLSGFDPFVTFCVQRNEHIKPDNTTTYYVVGVSQASVGNVEVTALEPTTAYLYTQFRAGALPNYKYTGADADRAVTADALQRAIWHFQGQFALADLSALALQYVNLAKASGWTTTGNVAIMNLRVDNATGAHVQDQLTLLPAAVPEPTALLLMGTALVGLATRLRRRRA